MKFILSLLILVLLSCTVSAEVGPIISFTSETTTPTITTSNSNQGNRGGGGSSDRNTNNCGTRVNATNVATGLCGEYSVCYLPPHYILLDKCVKPANVKITAPIGTYNRTKPSTSVEVNPSPDCNGTCKIELDGGELVINEPKKNETVVDVTEVDQWDFTLWGYVFVMFIVLLALFVVWISKRKKASNLKLHQDVEPSSPAIIQPPPTVTAGQDEYDEESWRDF